jgi:hypothetical protein
MFYGFGDRQRELLEKLLFKKTGLTILNYLILQLS